MDGTDDFDRLGRAVARVLRDAFATAEAMREEGLLQRAHSARVLDEELAGYVGSARAVPSKVADQAATMSRSLHETHDSALAVIESLLLSAQEEARAIRTQALTDARAIVAQADEVLDRARGEAEVERDRARAEAKAGLAQIKRSVMELEDEVRSSHRATLEKAAAAAKMILDQARRYHQGAADEVDRMIEAAAADAAELRRAALDEGSRLAARMASVVDVDRRSAPTPILAPERPPSASPGAAPPMSAAGGGGGPVRTPAASRGRRHTAPRRS